MHPYIKITVQTIYHRGSKCEKIHNPQLNKLKQNKKSQKIFGVRRTYNNNNKINTFQLKQERERSQDREQRQDEEARGGTAGK